MKTILTNSLKMTFLFMLILACSKENLPDQGVYFYTDIDDIENNVTLSVNGKEQGVIAYFSGTPMCADKHELTFVAVTKGEHNYTIRVNDIFVSEGSFDVTKRSVQGGLLNAYLDQGECIILHYAK